MIINSSEELRSLTGSYYANNDFEKIATMVAAVEQELKATLGMPTLDTLEGDALLAASQAVAYMATMRFYRLNDISHENMGRKVKIDRENEARPFEWQLARDDRMHLEEYYRALDRLIFALRDNEQYRQSDVWKRQQQIIVKDAASLTWITGADESPWLYLRLVPFLAESQHFVERAYGEAFKPEDFSDPFPSADTIDYAAMKAVSLGAIALMGRRTSLQTLPYGLMQMFESDGGGNRREHAEAERLDNYIRHLSKEQHYWLEEMKRLRDLQSEMESASHLQIPDNNPKDKFMRV